MASDLNQCNFIGRLGEDPTTRYMPSGDAVTNFSIACGEKWKDKSGNVQEATEWVRCSCFGKLAEVCGEYLRKGSQVFISGKMKTRKWQAQDGSDRYSTEIVVGQMQMLGSKPSDASTSAARQQPAHTQQRSEAPPANFDNFDDDIPF